jgi:hypothetical protein
MCGSRFTSVVGWTTPSGAEIVDATRVAPTVGGLVTWKSAAASRTF